MPQANSTISMPRETSPCASENTLPCSLVMRAASASRCSFSSARNFANTRVRRNGGVSAQARHAARALATAAAISLASPSAISRSVAPLAGLSTASGAPAPAIACPPIQCGTSSGLEPRAASAGEESVVAAMADIIDQLHIAPHTDAPIMGIELLFPTQVYRAALRSGGSAALNARLLRECRQLRVDDSAGRRWSARHYPDGYTSYCSAHRMQRISPSFAALARELDRHVARFARALQFDLGTR